MVDVSIIGGGIAGLSTGAILASRGIKVILFEKNRFLGGRASYLEKDGYTADFGIHVNRFSSYGSAAKVFRTIGERLELVEIGPPTIYYSHRFLRIPRIPMRIKLPSVYINDEPLLACISSGLRKHLNPEENYMITLKDLIGRFGKGANRLINFLSGAGITCPGEKASAGEFLDFLQKVVISGGRIGYPKGGTKQIITKLSRKLESSGRIMRRAKVDEIVVKGNTARGVRVGKRIIRSKAVVCAFPLQFLFGIIDEELFHPEFRKVKNLEPSAGISIDFGLRKKVSDIDGVILTFDPLTMGMFTSNIDPGVAPKNKQLGTWFYQLPDVRGKREKEIKNLKALLAEIFPGIWKNVEWERVMKLPMVDGAILKPGQTRYERPDFCSTVKGLFFAGDTTRGEGCGGDIAFDSAIKCSEKILGFLSSSFPPLH